MKTDIFQESLELFLKYLSCNDLSEKTIKNYKSRITGVDKWNDNKCIEWINVAVKNAEQNDTNAINELNILYDKYIKSNGSNISDKLRVNYDYRSNYIRFAKWLIGQYQSDIWMSLDDFNFEYCQLVAKNAIFCTIYTANQIKNGEFGCKEKIKNHISGYSFYNNKYRRIKNNEKSDGTAIRNGKPIPVGELLKENDIVDGVVLDTNKKAKKAIEISISNSLPIKLKFKDYIACHIWDKTCYDEHYHTSVYNIVLVPKDIAGLTDHNDAVKAMLRYEAAHRFGMYPKGFEYPAYQSFYANLIWRQQDEHKLAKHKIFKEI